MLKKLIPMLTALSVASTFIAPSTQPFALAAAPSRCSTLTSLSLPNTTINSGVDTPAGEVPPPFPGFPSTPVVATCRVHATVTTPGVNDTIGVDVWLPISGWNGRFQRVGGGGYRADDPSEMAAGLA